MSRHWDEDESVRAGVYEITHRTLAYVVARRDQIERQAVYLDEARELLRAINDVRELLVSLTTDEMTAELEELLEKEGQHANVQEVPPPSPDQEDPD